MKVVVIGAGVAGLGIGWRLAQTGAEVVVLERAQPGRGATWASAGMIAPAAESGAAASSPDAKFSHYSSSLWPDFAAELEAASGFQIGYRKSGSLICALSDQKAAELRGGPGQWLSAGEALAMEPMLTPSIKGAAWLPEEAQVDNRALGRALASAFMRAGGKLLPNEAVIRLEMDPSGVFAARTPFAAHEGDAFVLAAGAWSGRIDGLPPHALPAVRPVKGQMIALRPPKGAPAPGPMLREGHVYLVPREDRLLVGATVEEAGFDTGLTQEAEQELYDGAVALLPDLERWPVCEHWAGLRPGSPDGLPILGRAAIGRLFVATGQFRNGILFAPAVAEALSALVLGREPVADIAAFDPRRFERG